MFSLSYQKGNAGVEVLSSNGKDPLKPAMKLAKVTGKVDRVFDRASKGYCFELVTAGSSSLLCPATTRQSLGLTQRFLVLQMRVPEQAPGLTFEVVFLDDEGRRRRLHFSSNFRNFEPLNELSAQVPLNLALFTDMWTNFIVDMEDLAERAFPGARFGSVDGMVIKPCCHIRKIFTLPVFNEETAAIPAAYDFLKGTVKAPNTVFRAVEHCREKVDSRQRRQQKAPTKKISGTLGRGGVQSEGTGTTTDTSLSAAPSRDLSRGSASSAGRTPTNTNTNRATPEKARKQQYDASPFKNTAKRYNEREHARMGLAHPVPPELDDSILDDESEEVRPESVLMKLPSPAEAHSVDLSRSAVSSPVMLVKTPIASRFSDVRLSPSSPVVMGGKKLASPSMNDDDTVPEDVDQSNYTGHETSGMCSMSGGLHDHDDAPLSVSLRSSIASENKDMEAPNPWEGLRGPGSGDKAHKLSLLTGAAASQESSVSGSAAGAAKAFVNLGALDGIQFYDDDDADDQMEEEEDGVVSMEDKDVPEQADVVNHEFYDDAGPVEESCHMEDEKEFIGGGDGDDGVVLMTGGDNSLEVAFEGAVFYEDQDDVEGPADLSVGTEGLVGQGPASVDSEWSAESYGAGPARFSIQFNRGEASRGMVASLEGLNLNPNRDSRPGTASSGGVATGVSMTVQEEKADEVMLVGERQAGTDVHSYASDTSDSDEEGNEAPSWGDAHDASVEDDGWAQIAALEEEFAVDGNVIQGVLGGDEAPANLPDAALIGAAMNAALIDGIPAYPSAANAHLLHGSMEITKKSAPPAQIRPATAPKKSSSPSVAVPSSSSSFTGGDHVVDRSLDKGQFVDAKVEFDSSGRFPLATKNARGETGASPQRLQASRMSMVTAQGCLEGLQENLRAEEHEFLEEYGVEDFLTILGGDAYSTTM